MEGLDRLLLAVRVLPSVLLRVLRGFLHPFGIRKAPRHLGEHDGVHDEPGHSLDARDRVIEGPELVLAQEADIGYDEHPRR